MQIKQLLTDIGPEPVFVSGEKTVAEVLDLMSGQGLSAVLISTGHIPAGIFTVQDLMRCHQRCRGKDLNDIRICQVMTEKLVVAEPDDTVEAAMAMMIQARIRHLPVVADQRIIGLVGLEDLVRSHVGALTQELHYLKDYISDLQDAAHD